MSYTTFDVATENAAWKPDAEPKTITVTVKVTNTGSCAGKEVVQIYAACPFGKLKKERKRLVAFGKTALLQPGESETLHLKVPTVLLESYRTGKAVYCMEAGDYDFLVGTSSRDVTLAARLTLDKTVETEHLTNICPLLDALKEIQPEEEKEELSEIVDFLKRPQNYTAMGARIPKGVLLVGPPGTGKTLMARAVAGEAGVQFLSISGSDFVELYVGVGASRVRDLFEQAKKVAPAIIFIDEIDAVGRQRGSGLGGGHDEREQTLNQLLVEMDGFTNNEGVIVMAATNRADILDNALLRPGRFDRRVYMGLPDIKGREEILKVHARGKPLGDDVDLKSIARGTAGFAGADLENLLNEAAILATRSKRRFIMQEDIDEAILKVVMGPEKKSRIVSERARRLTAYHESGHAIASFFLKNSDPVHYITIIPRGAAGGFTWYRKAEAAEGFTSRGEMFDSIVSALGGRIAEQLFLDDISTGASGDIQQATNVARDMVMKYGMSEKLGPISFDDSSHSIFIGRDFGTTKSYSEETAATIDEEVKHIFDQAYAKCEALLREHADLLTGLAEYLLIHETIEGDDFRYYCEHGQMPIHPDDTIEPPAKVIRRMDEAPVAPQPEAETQPTDGDTPDGGEKTE